MAIICFFLSFCKLGEPSGFVCTVRSEDGDGSFYEPPEMQWVLDGGFPKDNDNLYEKVWCRLLDMLCYHSFVSNLVKTDLVLQFNFFS